MFPPQEIKYMPHLPTRTAQPILGQSHSSSSFAALAQYYACCLFGQSHFITDQLVRLIHPWPQPPHPKPQPLPTPAPSPNSPLLSHRIVCVYGHSGPTPHIKKWPPEESHSGRHGGRCPSFVVLFVFNAHIGRLDQFKKATPAISSSFIHLVYLMAHLQSTLQRSPRVDKKPVHEAVLVMLAAHLR